METHPIWVATYGAAFAAYWLGGDHTSEFNKKSTIEAHARASHFADMAVQAYNDARRGSLAD